MCDFGGKQSAAASTTPTYVPPAQTSTTGPAAAVAPGVNVKGSRENRSNGAAQVTNFRRAGGSGGQVDDPSIARKRRSASASLGL